MALAVREQLGADDAPHGLTVHHDGLGARLAGEDVSPLPAQAVTIPRTIGAAAARDRRQRMPQDGG